jgi:hypothetical protein
VNTITHSELHVPGRHREQSRCRFRSLVTLGLLLAAGPLAAQEAPIGVITGSIISATTGAPIAGATISVAGTGRRDESGLDGRFRIDSVAVGVVTLEAIAIGFTPALVADVVVSTGRPASLRIALAPRPVELLELIAIPSLFAVPPGSPDNGRRLDNEEIRRSPGSQEDVLRTVALLPGVGVTSASRNDLVVRGGAPFENLFTIDGIPIADLNHFGTQGSTGGPVSLVNLDLVEDVTFSAGGFGVPWGNRTGSVTAVRLRDGNTERLAGKANLSATGLGVSIEGPVGEGTTFIASVRRSYLDLLFSLAGFSFLPSYWDLNTRITTRLGDRDQLSFTGIGAIDRISFNNETAEDRRDNGRIPAINQDRYIAGMSWSRSLDRGQFRLTLDRAGTRFETLQRDSLQRLLFTNSSRESSTSLRAALSNALTETISVRLGAEVTRHGALRYDVDLPGEVRRNAAGAPAPLTVDTSFTAWQGGGFAELTARLPRGASVTLGGRFDEFAFLEDGSRLAPRLSLTVPLGDRTSLALRGGRYWQAPAFLWLAGDPDNPDRLTPFRVDAAVVGLEHRPRTDLRFQVEGYLKRYADYPARLFRPQAVLAPSGFGDAQTDIPFGLEPIASVATGRAYGVELLGQKRFSEVPVYGLASVSVGRVEFTGLDGVTRPGAYDTRVIATLAAGWRPNASWEYGAKFRFATGAPTTPFVLDGPLRATPDFARYNAGPRLPTFHALDIRIDRRWAWRGVQLVAYLDVQNVYGRANASRYEWDDETQAVLLDTGLGRLPSIGVSVEW